MTKKNYHLSEKEKEEYRGILKNCFKTAAAFDGQEHHAFDFYKAANLIDVFVKARNNGKISPDLESEFAKQSGVDRKHTVQWFMEDAAERAYGMMSRLGDLEDVLKVLESRGALIDHSDLTYVLTDSSFPKNGEGITPLEPIPFKRQPRLSILVKELETIGVYTDDLIIRVGNIFTNKTRRLPYLIVEIPRIGKSVAICEQYAETTFVSQTILPAYIWAGQTKNQLKAREDIKDISFNGKWPFRVCNILLYGIDKITPTPGQPPPKPGSKIDLNEYELKQIALKQPLTEEFILFHAWEHYKKKELETGQGVLPKENSGAIDGLPDERWSSWFKALRNGGRRLKRSTSMNQLYVDAGWMLGNLTEEIILEHAQTYYENKKSETGIGKFPTVNSGTIDDLPGEAWKDWESALTQGYRGLPGNSSLRTLYREKGWILGDLTEEIILDHAEKYYKKQEAKTGTGILPTRNSGTVDGLLGETWQAWEIALAKAHRNLPEDSSLKKLYIKKGWALGNLTEEIILEYAWGHYKKYNQLPSKNSGHPQGLYGETWNAFDKALTNKRRGLTGKSSLSQLFKNNNTANNFAIHLASDNKNNGPKPF
jgi:hypothetical protein